MNRYSFEVTFTQWICPVQALPSKASSAWNPPSPSTCRKAMFTGADSRVRLDHSTPHEKLASCLLYTGPSDHLRTVFVIFVQRLESSSRPRIFQYSVLASIPESPGSLVLVEMISASSTPLSSKIW